MLTICFTPLFFFCYKGNKTHTRTPPLKKACKTAKDADTELLPDTLQVQSAKKYTPIWAGVTRKNIINNSETNKTHALYTLTSIPRGLVELVELVPGEPPPHTGVQLLPVVCPQVRQPK